MRGRKVRNLTLREKHRPARRPNLVTADETQQDRKLAVETKLILRGVKESPNAYPPLKSVAEGLCFVLENWEVCSPPARSNHNSYGRSSGQK